MPEHNVETSYYAPTFKISIKNCALLPSDVISADVDESVDKPAMFTLTLNEELDIDTQEFTWLDKNRDLIMPGNKVVIDFGYVDHLEEFKGVIKALSPGFSSSGVPALRIEGYDRSHNMQKGENKFKKKNVKYSDVAKEIAKKYDLSDREVASKDKKYPWVKRNKKENDYALLQRLAKRIGYEFFVRNDILYFRPPADKGKKTASFEYRKNFISFTPRLTTALAVHEVTVIGWDEKSKKKIKATATLADIKSNLGIQDFDKLLEDTKGRKTKKKIEGRVVKSKEDAKLLAIAELKRFNNGFISGSLELLGNPYLRPGMTIEITLTKSTSTSVKNWFNGMYYINGAKHSLSDSGYTTTLEVRRCL